jgi:pseudouridine kinase
VVCVGGAVLDRTLRLAAAPVPGSSNPARMSTGSGGVARNVAENLARLGVPVALVSRVGDDDSGRELLAGLDRAGVDRSAVREVAGAATAQYVALLDPAGELVIAAAAMDLFDGFDPDHVLPAAGAATGLVLADTNLPGPVLAALVAAGRYGALRLAVDAVSTAKVTRLPADLTGVAVLFCNQDEAQAWLALPGGAEHDQALHGQALHGQAEHGRAADDGPVVAAQRLVDAGAEQVVLTLGAGGALLAGPQGVLRLPAEPVPVVDVTGAGDALVAGTLAGLVRGRSPAEAVANGVRLASRTVAVQGSVVQAPAVRAPAVQGQNEEER